MIKINPPSLTPSQKKKVADAESDLEAALSEIDRHNKEIVRLRKKQSELQTEHARLEKKAAGLDAEAELALVAISRQIERVQQAIDKAESGDDNSGCTGAVQASRKLVREIALQTFDEFIDLQVEAISPFYLDRGEARLIARTSPASREFIFEFLSESTPPPAPRELLRRLRAILEGSTLWEFAGANSQTRELP